MGNILSESLFLQLLARFFRGFSRLWRESAICGLGRSLHVKYENSLWCARFERDCLKEEPSGASLYGRLLIRLRLLWEAFGEKLEESLFCCGLRRFGRWYLEFSAGSLVFSRLNRLGIHQWALVIFALYLPVDWALRDIVGIGVLSSLWEEAFLAGAVCLILWRVGLKETKAISRTTPVDMFILLFFAVGFMLMCMVCPYPAIAFAGYRAQVTYILWFFLLIRLIGDEKDLKLLFYVLIGMGAVLGLHGIYQYAVGVEIPASWTTSTESAVRTRVFSITGSPNIFGDLLLMLAPLSAALIYYCRSWQGKLAGLLITGIMCLSMLFTFSRGAWVGLGVAVLVFSLLLDKRLIALMGTGVALALVFVPSITARLTFLFTPEYAAASAVGGRAMRWSRGMELLTSGNPWLGFGLGRFGGAVAMNNQVLETNSYFKYFYMDNYYLKTLVEMGYVGLFFYLLMMAALVFFGIRAVARSGFGFQAREDLDPVLRNIGNYKVIAAGIYAGLLGVLVHCYFENIFEETYMMAYFWGLAAMLMFLGYHRKRED